MFAAAVNLALHKQNSPIIFLAPSQGHPVLGSGRR